MEGTEKYVTDRNISLEETNPRKEDPLVTVIVVHHRGHEILQRCLESLFNSNYDNFKVILVDNGSEDGSVEYVEKLYHEKLEVIRSEVNLGFAKGYNLVLGKVNSKYVVLLNDDTVLDSNWLKFLVQASEKNPSIGSCQPKLKSFTTSNYFEYNGACGGMLDIYGTPLCRGRIFDFAEEDKGQYDTTAEVFWASGAAMFLRTKVLRETGLLDEMLYAHMEEIDLSWRMRLLGYHVLCVPQSVVYHVGGSTWANRPLQEQLYLKHRNNLIVMLKNYEIHNLIRFFTVRIFLDIGLLIYSLAKENGKKSICVLRAYSWILRNFQLVLAARRHVQNRRRVSDNKIISAMVKKSVAIQYYLLGRKFFSNLHDLPLGLDHYMSRNIAQKSRG